MRLSLLLRILRSSRSDFNSFDLAEGFRGFFDLGGIQRKLGGGVGELTPNLGGFYTLANGKARKTHVTTK